MKTLYYSSRSGRLETRKISAGDFNELFTEEQREKLAQGRAVTIEQSIGVGTMSMTYATDAMAIQ